MKKENSRISIKSLLTKYKENSKSIKNKVEMKSFSFDEIMEMV